MSIIVVAGVALTGLARVILLNSDVYFRDCALRDALAQQRLLLRWVGWWAAHPDWQPPPPPPGAMATREWRLLSLSYLCQALYEHAQTETPVTRADADRMRACIDEAMRPRTYAFVAEQWGDPFALEPHLEGNVLYLGHLNLMLGLYRSLTGDTQYDPVYQRVSIALHRSFETSPTRCVDTYPNVCWTADQAPALASLIEYDRQFKTRYGDRAQEWVGWLKEHLDDESGLFPAMVNSRTGQIYQGPRGRSLASALPYLFKIDPDFAAQQYAAFKKYYYRRFLGVGAFREWPVGKQGFTDIDTGPIVGGLGATATGFGLAAAKAAGDRQTFSEVLQLLEIIGAPLSLWQWKDYLLTPRVGDAVLLWAKALPPQGTLSPAAHRDYQWLPWYLALVLVVFSSVLLVMDGSRRRARTGLEVCQLVRDGHFQQADNLIDALHPRLHSPWHRRCQTELRQFVTRAMLLDAVTRQEWVRKSDMIGLAFGTLSALGLGATYLFLLALHAHKLWYLATLIAAYFILGATERWMDDRLWRKLVAGDSGRNG